MDIYIWLLLFSISGIVVLGNWLVETIQSQVYQNIPVYLLGIGLSIYGLIVALKDILN